MNLLVIRHAIAEDRETFGRTGQDDELRPLTSEGRRKMKEVARGLHGLVPDLDVLATSPLVRAAQTAEIVAKAYGQKETAEAAQLRPSAPPQSLLEWLEKHGTDSREPDSAVAVVGHEPHLGMFVSWLLTGRQRSFVELKKGGACLLELDASMKPTHAKLLWLLSPAQLRRLGND
jgi:phosphohistidine phosphatase